MKRIKTIRESITDINGITSSKRLVIVVCLFIVGVCVYCSLFMDKIIQEFIYDGIILIICTSIAGVASEQFSKRYNNINRIYNDNLNNNVNNYNEEENNI